MAAPCSALPPHLTTLAPRPSPPPCCPQLGVQCSTVQDESITHVVATDHTDKTRWAKRGGKHVVNPNWLWCSGGCAAGGGGSGMGGGSGRAARKRQRSWALLY